MTEVQRADGRAEVRVEADYVGERIAPVDPTRPRGAGRRTSLQPLGAGGWVVLYEYGVVVFVGTEPSDREAYLAELQPRLIGAFHEVEREAAAVRVDPAAKEGPEPDGAIIVRDLDPMRVALLAEVLAKSTALAHYEREVGRIFDQLEPLTRTLRAGKELRGGHAKLLTQLGATLATQARVMGRHEVVEKPDATWDDPELDRLYERLAHEYELADRARILDSKAEFAAGSIRLLIDLAQQRQSIRLEWYIVILIVIEIFIYIGELIAGRG